MDGDALIRCAPDDPGRCQAVTSQGQCTFLAEPGKKNCRMHGGGNGTAARSATSAYNIPHFQRKIQEKCESPKIKSLREEIGLLRLVIESIINKCDGDVHALIMQSQVLSDLIMKVDKVVNSCHKLEASSGQLLDKAAVITFAGSVVSVIAEYITDQETLQQVAERIGALITPEE